MCALVREHLPRCTIVLRGRGSFGPDVNTVTVVKGLALRRKNDPGQTVPPRGSEPGILQRNLFRGRGEPGRIVLDQEGSAGAAF